MRTCRLPARGPFGPARREPFENASVASAINSLTRGEREGLVLFPDRVHPLSKAGVSFEIVEQLAAWKESSREGSRAKGDLYLRRHYYRLQMSDESTWVVYFVRQSPRSGNPRNRWFLYTIERSETSGTE